MHAFGEPWEDSPNDKPYVLRYEDGGQFAYRTGRGAPQREFSLMMAISVADHEAGQGVALFVVDPETSAVLWVGQRGER